MVKEGGVMSEVLTEEVLERDFPEINWREPLPVSSAQGKGLACRFCIAFDGLKGKMVPNLPQNKHEFAKHLREVHGREVENNRVN